MTDESTAGDREGATEPVEDAAAVSDAFATLGDETRVAILEALVEARRGDPEERALTFSELRERTGIDDSGRFNYHLGKLRGRFVEETDEGYVLSYAGREVVGAILAGTYDTDVDPESEPLDDTCPFCDEGLRASFDAGEVAVGCENDHTVMRTSVAPSAAADRSMDDILSLAARQTYTMIELVTGGVCTDCSGRLDREIVPTETELSIDYAFTTTCRRCGAFTSSSAGAAVLRHPAFVGFCHDHGIDVVDRLPWTLPLLTDGETTRTSADPPRYRVRVEADDEVLDLTLDERGVILDTERTTS
ncbi:ArsR/SmtB family transcription factor [Haloarchaeobius iranensis]|uniref:Helix-turn-helix domain-containing protein n=1 Tax=Haloarchaeobius iranensis TaxID=996166 RepID=A0A1H0AHN1_9EURY|nr:winged helix-turn-helix domain-containing protein [Haloarchaeobius iranensis]SDN32887.1 Helix-turn-helix domain-containing protein [Haloarchaeobius iranensis]